MLTDSLLSKREQNPMITTSNMQRRYVRKWGILDFLSKTHLRSDFEERDVLADGRV
jgi:hypothetical protein